MAMSYTAEQQRLPTAYTPHWPNETIVHKTKNMTPNARVAHFNLSFIEKFLYLCKP
jgi:hypothetical protein